MDLRLREVTWVRLLSFLLWTLLVMLKKANTQLIEVIESVVFDGNNPFAGERDRESSEGKSMLLSPLSDELVLSQIWPLMHLWRLRRVNRAWKRNVGSSLEWAALEMVRVDTPGLICYLRKTGELRPSLRERVESELTSLEALLCEQLSDFASSPKLTPLSADDAEMSEAGGEESRIGTLSKRATGNVERDRDCVRRWIDYTGFEKFQDKIRNEYDWSEEEEIEAYASSSESSMRVHYPRHAVRF